METFSSICKRCGHCSQKFTVDSSFAATIIREWRCPVCRAEARHCRIILDPVSVEEEIDYQAERLSAAPPEVDETRFYASPSPPALEPPGISLLQETYTATRQDEGLDLEELYSLPCHEAKDATVFCGVCQDPAVGDEVTFFPNCTHRFHKLCINPWILSNNSCPICRKPVVIRESDNKGRSPQTIHRLP